MTPFFAPIERQKALQAAILRWQGTPFVQNAGECGVGVDCVRFVREVWREAGADVSEAEKIPSYELSWGRHQDKSQVLAWLHDNLAAREMLARVDYEEGREPLPGDLILVRPRQALSCHHVGVVFDYQIFYHVHISAGVMPDCIAYYKLADAIMEALRLMEPEPK